MLSHMFMHILLDILLMQLWVGILLLYQPFYVGGIEDLDLAKESAFGSMVIFCITFVLSLVGLCRDARVKRRQVLLARTSSRSATSSFNDCYEYDQVPVSAGMAPSSVMEAYEMSMELPSSVLERANSGMSGGRLSRRASRTRMAQQQDLDDDNLLTQEELESSFPPPSSAAAAKTHVPEGQLLPTTHV